MEPVPEGKSCSSMGCKLYYTWQARNWMIFRKGNVDRDFVFGQIKREITYILDILHKSTRARKSQLLIQKLCN